MKNRNQDNNGINPAAMPDTANPAHEEFVPEYQPLELPSHDVLAQLARDDPAAYEALRHEVIKGFIDSAPERLKPRLNGIQFRVDSVRRLSRSSALGATVKIYQLMWKSFQHLNEVWQDFVPLKEQFTNKHKTTPATKYAPRNSARILAFRPRLPCDQ